MSLKVRVNVAVFRQNSGAVGPPMIFPPRGIDFQAPANGGSH